MHSFKSIKIIDSGKSIMLQRTNGSSVRYHSTWLRDNASDPKTRDSKNGQRLITLSDIPINIYIKSATLDAAGKNIFLTFLPEKKIVSFTANWLETHVYDTKQNNIKGWVKNKISGEVETLLIGNDLGVKNLIDLCEKGPPSSKVTSIIVQDYQKEYSGKSFEIIET